MSLWDFLRDPIGFLTTWFYGVLAGWGVAPGVAQAIGFALGSFILATGAMLFVMLLIWFERKVIARIQDRIGPNRIGPWGLFQSVADMLKIFTKEYITPIGVDWLPYNLAPVLSVASVLVVWAVIPFSITFYGADLNVGLLFVIAIASMGELAIVMAGWGSNNKYALLGAFRAVGQMISYATPMVVALLVPVMMAGSLSLNEIVQRQTVWYILVSPVAALIFFIASIAEVGRSPFDLVEAESELVSGFNVEYSGLKFGMFYVGEFLHAFTAALLFTTLFLGGWRGPGAEQIPILGFIYYVVKTGIVYFLTVLIRGSLPRFRMDQMMDLNWKLLTPLSLAVLLVTALTNKLLEGLALGWRVVVLILLNGLVLWVVNGLLQRYERRRVRREVTSVRRPVARPQQGGAE
ncbi:MAG: NADH-quinone oxidoreductase subunit NuoH [Longilinea sp.]|nr:NADH-quinone oxidoreductase subunit NuoH [Longilinea sp.]MCA1953782.1 NADH-quinone oxidoreductase subunit NuoH [Anaerolinea sp.]